MILDNAKRFVARKIKKIEFLNTNYPQDYEAVNIKYRRLRDELDYLCSVTDSLSTYEYGGAMLKSVSKLGSKLLSTTNLNIFNGKDVYTEAAAIGEELANTTHSSTIKATGTRFNEAYTKIANAKKEMNVKLKEIAGSIRGLKDEVKVIDGLRRI